MRKGHGVLMRMTEGSRAEGQRSLVDGGMVQVMHMWWHGHGVAH